MTPLPDDRRRWLRALRAVAAVAVVAGAAVLLAWAGAHLSAVEAVVWRLARRLLRP